MRLILALTLFASPAAAWEFMPSPVCTLTDTSAAGTITLTYDPALPEYTVTITLADGAWDIADRFVMTFAGDRPKEIATDRHRISPDGRSLSVSDSGFGNVLDGLEFNQRAYAIAGGTTIGIGLDGIGPAMQAFRACPDANLA